MQKGSHICEHGAESPSCPVGQGSFKLGCFKVEKCSMVRRVQIWHSCWKSWTSYPLGYRGGRPSSVLSAFSSNASISDGMGVHKCIRYGQLACFGRHYECWKVYQDFRATYCSPPDYIYFNKGLLYFSRTTQNHILQLLQQHGFIVEESGCWIGLPAVQIFHL